MGAVLYRAKAINRDVDRPYRTTYRNGDWVYGLLSRFDDFGAQMTNEIGVTNIDVDPQTICRYTGLTDKNSNRIFECDIVSLGDLSAAKICGCYVVRYNLQQARYSLYTLDGIEQTGFNRDTIKNYEVIGNIYDNAYLLGGQQ